MRKEKKIFKVHFPTPPFEEGEFADEKTFYFSTLTAIYEIFTPQQIGCKVGRLWKVGLPKGKSYVGKKCIIERHSLWMSGHEKEERQ